VEAFQFVWLDKPDKTKIEAGFARVGERVDNNKFREMIWESLLHLSEGEGFLLDHEGNLNANRLDDLLVGLEHAAHWKKMKDLDAKIEHQEEERRRKDKEYSRWEQRERMWDMEYRRKR
jgi:hypothetical protein